MRVKVNAKDFGVYHYETAADESLLRAASRMPGSIYASELPGSASSQQLWTKTHYWTKVSSRTDSEIDRSDFTDLWRFLGHFHDATNRQFADFARHELDVETFARLDALDVAFGGDQRDFRENHTYYFDPVSRPLGADRWRVSWLPRRSVLQSRGQPGADPAEDAARVPEPARSAALRISDGQGQPDSGARPRHAACSRSSRQSSAPILTGMPIASCRASMRFTAAWCVPTRSAASRSSSSPRSRRTATVTLSSWRSSSETRSTSRWASPRRPRAARQRAAGFVTDLSLVIDGHSGVGLSELAVTFGEECQTPRARLSRRGRELATRGRAGQIELAEELPLYPSVGVVPRADPDPRRGSVRADELPIVYPLRARVRAAVP